MNKFLLLLSVLFFASTLNAQQLPERRTTPVTIPGIVSISATEFHLYVLSESDGLVVFRNYADSLQWLYTAEGMQRRGKKILADSRFAYIIQDAAVSVIEPTSMLGVFSSTTLPETPRNLLRMGDKLFAAVGQSGLLQLSLTSSEAFDSAPKKPYPLQNGASALDLVKQGNTLLLLTSEPAVLSLAFSGDSVSVLRKYSLDRQLEDLAIIDQTLSAFDGAGNLYQIQTTGKTVSKGSIQEPVETVVTWSGKSFIRGKSGAVWMLQSDGQLVRFRKSGGSGNHIAAAKNLFWMTEYASLSDYHFPVKKSTGENTSAARPALKPIPDAVISYPRPFLEAISLASGTSSDIRFFVRSATANGIIVEGNGLYWQPASKDIGRHSVTLIASNAAGMADSTSFMIDVRPFNAPPRFAPLQPVTIAANELFELPLKAVDPDGANPDLIRYLGVNLPETATLNEKTGLFSWKPAEKHIGAHTFRIIASDQFGAATAQEIRLDVQKSVR